MTNRFGRMILTLLVSTTAPPVLAQVAPADIVVTAEKRTESLQKVPFSVSVLSGDEIARQNIKDLLEAAPLVNGMVFSRAPDDGLGISYRGLGTISRSAELEQSVSLFQDGVPFAKGRLYTTAFFDVDRMEFIKGTESSLLGKNSSLGAISVVDHQPGKNLSFVGSAGYEFFDKGYMLDAASDIPVSNKASLRVATHYNDLGGWVHNDALDRDGPDQKDLGIRAILRVAPTELLTLSASYQHSENHQFGQSMQLVGDIPPSYGDGVLDDHSANFTSQTKGHQTTHRTISNIASLKGELQLGDDLLTAQTSYVGYRLNYLDDLDFSTDDSVNFRRDERYWQVSQELRLQSPTGLPIDYMVGVFFLASHWHSLETQFWAVPNFPPPPDPASGQLFNGDFTNDFTEDSRTYSGYASGHWHASSRLTVSGGLRFSRETKDIITGRTPVGPLTIWNTIANPPFDPTALTHKASFLDGNVSVQYAIRPGFIAYASFGHGSKAGGYVETNTIAVPPSALIDGKVPASLVAMGSDLKDETAKSIEIGLKTLWIDEHLRFNIAVFSTDIHNFQDTVFTGGTLGFITFNGPARSRGFEIDSGFQATHRLSFDAAMTYADATDVIQPIDPATNAPEVDGADAPVFARYRRSQAPKIIVNAGTTYLAPVNNALDVRFDARMHHRSSMYNQRQDGFLSQPLTTLDLSLGLAARDHGWEVDLTAQNVTNDTAEDFASATVDPRFAAFYGAHAASPNRDRTLMLTCRIKI
jgi:iron complex outermembrane receptor protein